MPRTHALELELTEDQRGQLSGFLRHRALRGQSPTILVSGVRTPSGPGEIALTDALAAVPHGIGRIQDAVLIGVARTITRPGGETALGDDYAPFAYTLEPKDLWWHVGQLRDQGFLQRGRDTTKVQLTSRGWSRIEELERGTAADPDQAFVAMWFDGTMDAIYADSIAPAVVGAGFKPYRIKDVEHNNKICDEILAEIRKSRFLVAEFTGNRGGVYFEAGFAMGLGLPVVWVVSERDLAAVHFDTNHFNHITWATPEELKVRLQRRIEATIPRLPK